MTSPADTAADPVLALLHSERSDYRGLYYRWEHEQWEAGKVDFAADAAEWPRLDKRLRKVVEQAVGWRHLRARTATTALVPFVDVAPDEEQQVFLTTELVDEARHVVLFDRFTTEVLCAHDGGPTRAPELADPRLGPLLIEAFPDASRRLAQATGPDVALLAEAVAVYQVGIVGLLGLTEHRFLTELLARRGALGGLRRGLDLERRDAARHVAFALRLLQEADTAGTAGWRSRFGEVLELVLDALEPSSVGGAQTEMRQAAQVTCAAWFEAVDLEAPRVV